MPSSRGSCDLYIETKSPKSLALQADSLLQSRQGNLDKASCKCLIALTDGNIMHHYFFFLQVKKQQVEPDIEQESSSKLGKEYVKAVYCYYAYLTYMQSTEFEMPGWMKHKLESRLPGEISITSDMQMTPPLWHKVKKN